jgi:predicted PurR-regulated permease PerM
MVNYYPFRLAIVLICVILIVFIGAKLQVVIVPLIFSVIFSVMLFPLTTRLETWGTPRGIAAITSILIAAIAVGLLIYFLGNQTGQLAEQSPQLLKKLEGLYKECQIYISSHFGIKRSEQAEQIENQVSQLMDNSGKIVAAIFASIANFIADVTLIPLYVFFLLYYRDFFLEFFHRAFSAENKIIDDILSRMYSIIQSWLVGVVSVTTIVGTLNTVGLLLLGIPYAAFFGFLGASLLVIPYIGIIVGSLLPALMALITKDSYWYAAGVIGIYWFVQILEANIFTPYIVGSKISINPLVAVLMLILFGSLWGLSGLILALPVTAMCKVIFDTVPGMQAYGFVLGEPQKRYLGNWPTKKPKVTAKEKERKEKEEEKESHLKVI